LTKALEAKNNTNLGKFQLLFDSTELRDAATLEEELKKECEDADEFEELLSESLTLQIK
jgi:hypothetical protein